MRQVQVSTEEMCKVTVFGTPEAQAKAQYLIFRMAAGSEPDGVFKVEIHIPTLQAGRIIGRNGYTVKELQLYTNARIKIGDDSLPPSEETPVYITGDYLSTQVIKFYQ
jgi:insulin-like growth factor 2 mRNA-binding protein 1